MKKVMLVVCCLIFLVGCSNSNNSDKEKTVSEIKYFGYQISDILNNLNSIKLEKNALVYEKVNLDETEDVKDSKGNSSEGSEKNESQESNSNMGGKEVFTTSMQTEGALEVNTDNIDWSQLKDKVEILSSSWNVLHQDLYSLNIQETDIIAFEDLLNNSIISIKNENKNEALENLGKLYSYLPQFLSVCSADNQTEKVESTKYSVFQAYISVTENDWSRAIKEVTNSENSFLTLVNDEEVSIDKKDKINKTYILIKELRNSMNNRDVNLFLLKYTHLLEALNSL